jgi:UDP-glucuronate decarboxylase
MMKGKKIFITGGAGFIATRLISHLIQDNTIIVYDNLSRNSLKDSGLMDRPGLSVIQGDILDYNLLKSSIPPDIDVVFHMAAIAGIDNVIKDPVRTMEVNLIGFYNVLNVLREKGIAGSLDRLVDFSTSEVFGINAFRVDEKTPVNLQPVGEARWTYSISKLAGEHLVHSFHKKYGLKYVTVRPFNIYGPGQVGEGAIHHFVLRAIRNEDLVINGKGEQIRSWCFIDDMVSGALLCLENERAIGNSFNIGNPRSTITIYGLAEKIIELAGSRSRITFVPRNYADVELRIPNIDKAQEVLGFEPKTDLNEGIRKTIEWYSRKLN